MIINITKMATFAYIISNVNKFIPITTKLCGVQAQQVRTVYADWRMIRDLKRRKMVEQYAIERLRINSLRKNDILPPELREIADKEIASFPLNSCPTRIHSRCALTSRSRGLVKRWRLSRIVWRHYADYNKLSGVQRAMW